MSRKTHERPDDNQRGEEYPQAVRWVLLVVFLLAAVGLFGGLRGGYTTPAPPPAPVVLTP